jgi:LysM repeat protein
MSGPISVNDGSTINKPALPSTSAAPNAKDLRWKPRTVNDDARVWHKGTTINVVSGLAEGDVAHGTTWYQIDTKAGTVKAYRYDEKDGWRDISVEYSSALNTASKVASNVEGSMWSFGGVGEANQIMAMVKDATPSKPKAAPPLAPAPKTDATANTTPPPPAAPQPASDYTVKKGDSLWKIAEQYFGKGQGNRWREIYELNKDKIKDPNLIYPDQVFKMPPKTAPGAAAESSTAPGTTYTVKSGDTLSRIAKDNKCTVDDLLKFNPEIKDKDKISVDQKIRLPEKTPATPPAAVTSTDPKPNTPPAPQPKPPLPPQPSDGRTTDPNINYIMNNEPFNGDSTGMPPLPGDTAGMDALYGNTAETEDGSTVDT